MKSYPVSLEVSGPLAMWTRPDTGGAPSSYPVPTWSAAKGLLESIAYLSSGDATYHPTRVEYCRPRGTSGGVVRHKGYATNYGGPLRKEQSVKAGTSLQIYATVLSGVCYRIHADVRGRHMGGGQNPRHHLQELFERRIARGQCFRTPALGWREFTADYWGAPRDEWEVDDALDMDIASMLHSVWGTAHDGPYEPRFAQGAQIRKGVLNYAP